MKNIRIYRLVGITSIFSGLLFIVSIIGMQSYLAADLHDVPAFTQNMVEDHAMMLMYGWPGLMATLLMIPLFYVTFKGNTQHPFLSKMAFFVSLIGISFVLVGYLFHLAFTYFFAPIHQQMTSTHQEGFNSVFQAMVGLQDMFWLSGDLFSFLGFAALLVWVRKENFFPPVFIWIGVIAGILAAVGSVSFIPAFKQVPGLSLLFIGGFSVFTLWEIIIGFRWLRF